MTDGRRLLGLAGALVLVAACAAGPGTPASPAPTTTVDLPASYRFDPVAITVPDGATVTWSNSDHFTHNVQFLDGGLPSEPQQMEPGASTTFTFEAPGLFHYQCSLHPQDMKGSVEVAPQGG